MIAALKPLLARFQPGKLPALPAGALNSLAPLIALAVGVTALTLMFLWRDQSSYKPVFGAREKVVAADMMSVLDAEQLPYRIHPETGQVLVQEDMLGKVRMLLASKGVVAKLPAGLELMDRNDPLGVSQFVQDVRFRRGLEGDLSQSILAIDAVESARVHLAIAKSSSFVLSDGEQSSASVVVRLKQGRSLGNEQIAAVIKLVSGSVANLDPKRVSVVDQSGNLLSARVELDDQFEGVQGNEAARHYQEETRRNARDLLAQTLGQENYRISVTAEVDNDRIEETREVYGVAPKVTSEALREESNRELAAVGVPGSLSNRPVNTVPESTNPPGPTPTTANSDAAKRSATSRQYAYDRNITQIKRSRGRLRKLSVAVVLNNAAAPAAGKPWSAEQLADIEKMLQSGLGIDAARGDKLTVSTLNFPAAPVPEPWWQERGTVIDFASWATYAIGALLGYLLVLRPLLRLAQQRVQRGAPALPAPAAGQDAAAATAGTQALPGPGAAPPQPQLTQGLQSMAGLPMVAGAAQPGMPAVSLLENYDLPPAGSPVDVMVDHLKVLAAKEPERVAEVVKQWLQKNARPE